MEVERLGNWSSDFYAIKREDEKYFIGFNKFDSQLRKAKLYKSELQAFKQAKDSRFSGYNLKIVKVKIKEV